MIKLNIIYIFIEILILIMYIKKIIENYFKYQ